AGDNNQFVDLVEPFADRNHNGTHDAGEFFFDVNKNGVWNDGNGVWDGPCLKVLNPAALCPGSKTIAIFDQVTIVMSTNTPRIIPNGTFPNVGAAIFVTQGRSRTLANMVIGDINNNPLPNGTTVAFSIDGSGVSLQGITSTTIGNT